ncbi:hypothetical protein GCM10009114_23410 [Aliiglaciecola litoralis]|uniref:DUF218 domain-containing protein n=2 Tax=Aliiglaciecola litoralis TaxID=582857 RepID=A0ABN1LL56_9ALTE
MEALRILQFNPQAKIVTSGNVGREAFSNAYMTKQLLIALGVSENRIIQVEKSKDTAEEAQNLRQTLDRKPFALVTSATHMKRAVTLFKQQGLEPTPAPTEHLVRESDYPNMGYYVLNAKSIYHFERWWYEWMGNTWVWFKHLFD